MTLDEALAVLGSDRATEMVTIRGRYRMLLRRHHPDLAGASGQDRTAQLTQAWSVVERTAPWDPPSSTTRGDGTVRSPAPRATARPDVLPLPAPTLEVFNRLAEAADILGHLSYIDRQNGIMESVFRPEGGPSCSLLITIRQQGPDTLAECALEALEQRPAPPIAEVVAELQRIFDELEHEDR